MGTGGVGGAFGAALQDAGHDVVFVARGDDLRALREGGLRVSGNVPRIVLGEVRATDDPSDAGERDLTLLGVKTYDLPDAVEAIRPCGGLVLTLQNGVTAPDRVREALGDVCLAGSTGIVADLAGPGRVEVVSSYARIRFGEPDGGASERVERVAGWLRRSPRITVEPQADVREELWRKMALICAMAGLTTLYRSPVGPVLADPGGRATFRRALEEVESVARAKGAPVPDGFVEERMRYADGIDPRATSSMSRDLARGKRLEVDDLNGAIVGMGRELATPVPVNEAVDAGIRLLAR